jgi:hypothetical protein
MPFAFQYHGTGNSLLIHRICPMDKVASYTDLLPCQIQKGMNMRLMPEIRNTAASFTQDCVRGQFMHVAAETVAFRIERKICIEAA